MANDIDHVISTEWVDVVFRQYDPRRLFTNEVCQRFDVLVESAGPPDTFTRGLQHPFVAIEQGGLWIKLSGSRIYNQHIRRILRCSQTRQVPDGLVFLLDPYVIRPNLPDRLIRKTHANQNH